MNWTSTPLTRRLRLDYPLIQAPMAGGPTTPALVAAVSNAGGLGSLGAGYLEPEAIRATIVEIRALTDRPFAVNLFVPRRADAKPEQLEWSRMLLERYRGELGLESPEALPPLPDFEAQLAVLIDEGVDAFSFTFGVPGGEQLTELRDAGIVTLGTATHLLEGIVLEECGVDFVVAQGFEAGGHRGGFVGDPQRLPIGTMALVPLLARRLRTPVIAAGGIMEGRGLAAALALGACAAQLGTAFLACPESGAHPAYKRALLEATEIGTTLTRAFSGRAARALGNRFTRELYDDEADLPPYPVQHQLTVALRRAAAERGDAELMALWAGQGVALCRERPAAELIAEWVAQARAILQPSAAVSTAFGQLLS